MWKVINIHATNLCAFKTLDYNVPQNHTTLIFGNNMDNDSQGSNGSGKSAMLEALAIGITGETLRKIKMEEIINDSEDEATIEIQLDNASLNQYMTIQRILTRKSPQSISITIRHENEVEDVKEATVADFNRYILEAIGLSKEDVFSNFILSKHKYTSFLSSSDKDKKELINRFSNGNLVDESIAALQEDAKPIEEDLRNAETQVATCNGRVDAILEQINEAVISSEERSQKNAERIENWKKAIADKHAYQREQREAINKINDNLDELDSLDKELQDLESNNQNISQVYKTISEKFTKQGLESPKDYSEIVNEYRVQLEAAEKELDDIMGTSDNLNKSLLDSQKEFDKISKNHKAFQESYSKKSEKLKAKSKKLGDDISHLILVNKGLFEESNKISREISSLQTLLAGTIVCPKCKHEFILNNDANIDDLKRKSAEYKAELIDIESEMKSNQDKNDECCSMQCSIDTDINSLKQEADEWHTKEYEAGNKLTSLERHIQEVQSHISSCRSKVSSLENNISNARMDLFDEVFQIIDKAYKNLDNNRSRAELNIKTADGSIQSYEELIKEAENYSSDDVLGALNKNKDKYEKELETATAAQKEIEQKLNAYKQQESTFIEFKTFLANSKIDALSTITNEFLEEIGSDIRIVFSGYTKLKSGKIRDKISISLVRDGIDCGSFDKFSEGEKARVNLANILAMHKLTNLNCDLDKGLDLLVLDEILEATDEQGLTNIFNALNKLQITALVVSHGNIAEGYPYKTVVCKQNGISFINGTES